MRPALAVLVMLAATPALAQGTFTLDDPQGRLPEARGGVPGGDAATAREARQQRLPGEVEPAPLDWNSRIEPTPVDLASATEAAAALREAEIEADASAASAGVIERVYGQAGVDSPIGRLDTGDDAGEEAEAGTDE